MRKCGGMKNVLGQDADLLVAVLLAPLAVGCATAPVRAPGLPLKKRLTGSAARLGAIGKRIIEIGLLVNEQRVRSTEAIRAITLREPLAMN